MKCFQVESRTSEYLDSSLPPALQRNADQHVETCPECATRVAHLRTIKHQISLLSRATPPLPIRSHVRPVERRKSGLGRITRKWREMHWGIKVFLEAWAIAVVAAAIATGFPILKNAYEHRQDRATETDKELSIETAGDLIVDGRNTGDGTTAEAQDESNVHQTLQELAKKRGDSHEGGPDDFAGEGDHDSTADTGGETGDPGDSNRASGKSRRGSAIWRFSFRTDSPDYYHAKLITVLKASGMIEALESFHQSEVPGGIQFEFLIDQERLAGLRADLEKLGGELPKTSAPAQTTEGTESDASPDLTANPNAPFTWYKTVARKPLPAGKAKVVIWISQG